VSVMLSAAVVLFAAGWGPVCLLRSERFSERRAVAAPDERRAMLNAIAAVGVHVTLAELALTDPGAGPVPESRLAIGMLVFLVGLAFWMLARHTLVAVGGVLDPAVPPPTLVTTGPFAIVRHPLALGMVILALGPAVAAATALTWVSFAAVVVTLGRRCLQDEDELSAAFGATYERYAETTTSRLLPLVW
jgi:protein-S-isoprenylcysteine O-methyltransferase Ste14